MFKNELPGRGKRVGVIGVPLGYGAGKPGSELGAQAMRMSTMRNASLFTHIGDLGFEVVDHGDVDVVRPAVAATSDNPRFADEMVATFANVSLTLKKMLGGNEFPVILGGDHSIAIGTFAAISAHYREKGEEIGLIWFDAHADINTPETSLTGNAHGMPLAALLGYGDERFTGLEGFSPKIRPEFCAHVGARDLDLGEKRRVHEFGMRDHFFTMTDIDRRGMYPCVQEAIRIASQAPGGYAVTFDVDMLDPVFAPGSGTLVRGGATYREAHLALEAIA